MKKDSAFALLLGRQSTAQQRERLHQVRSEQGLGDNDALWGLVQVVEEFCLSLQATSKRSPPILVPTDAAPSLRGWTLISVGLAVQTFLMAISFYAGARGASSRPPVWLVGRSWVARALCVPAGWMIFAVLMPALGAGIRAGWIARGEDRAAGWVVIGSFSIAAVCVLATLWWLMAS